MKTQTFLSTPKPKPYSRLRDLPSLVALWPREIEDFTTEGNQHIVMMIEKSLRSERRRGKSNHWSYNLTRHIALLKAYKSETLRLKAHSHNNAGS